MDVCEATSRGIVILGAAIGSVAASRAARDLIRRSPREVRTWIAERREGLRRRWRAFRRWTRDVYTQARNWVLSTWEAILRRLGLTDTQTIRPDTLRVGVTFPRATITVGPPAMEIRVENLEEWRAETLEDERVEGSLLLAISQS